MTRIDRKKITLIHVAKARLNLDDDAYRAILERVGMVDSATKLDDDGFRRVMDEFARLGFRSDFSRRNFGTRVGMASPAQVAAIRRQWKLFTNGEAGDRELGAWLEKHFKVSALRFVPADLVSKVIGALKAMNARRHGTAAA